MYELEYSGIVSQRSPRCQCRRLWYTYEAELDQLSLLKHETVMVEMPLQNRRVNTICLDRLLVRKAPLRRSTLFNQKYSATKIYEYTE